MGAGFVLVTERALTEPNRHMAQVDRQLAAIERELAVNFRRPCNVTRKNTARLSSGPSSLLLRTSKLAPRYGERKSNGDGPSSCLFHSSAGS
jgi:hypothetical protein